MSLSSRQFGCFSGIFKRREHHRSTPVLSEGPLPCGSLCETKYDTNPNPVDAPDSECQTLNLCCDFTLPESDWTVSPDDLPSYSSLKPSASLGQFSRTVRKCLEHIDPELRELSLKIHGHPELQFKEKYAHDILTSFMESHGFHVTRHYLGLETAWSAEFTYGKGTRIIGVNSEMDALKGLGHACGHNLIAIGGCGVAIALKAAMEAHELPAKVILLGTPAEEGGGGKAILLERGAYKGMDLCVMCHPGPGPARTAGVGPLISMQSIEVEFFGQSAHAGASPWEGTNALDAAFLAYANVSVLRQQIKPDHRVHGIVEGKDWSPNGVIPDYAKMRWFIRAPTYTELQVLSDRIKSCFEAASLATGCKIKRNFGVIYFDMRQNSVLADEFANICLNRFKIQANKSVIFASSDFGNVSYAVPALHPSYAIPTEPNGGNHTAAFARSAASMPAHLATLEIVEALSLTALRAIYDDEFFLAVKESHTGTS